MNVSFQEVWMRVTKTGKCSVCGKTTRRSQKFWQTINPYNKNSDGAPKSSDEIRSELKAEADAWEPDFDHEKCKG